MALVDYLDGRPQVKVGSEQPTILADGTWRGHLALWLPTLRRFVDPTIYQANLARRGEPMGMGIVLAIPSLDALATGVQCEKNGSHISYYLVADLERSWEAGVSRGMQSVVRQAASTIHAEIRSWLQTPEGRSVRDDIVDPGIRGALQRVIVAPS